MGRSCELDQRKLNIWQAATFIKRIVEATPILPQSTSQKRGRSNEPEHRIEVERAAITRVTEHYIKRGYSIKSRQGDNCGWDLNARKGEELLQLEVKGLSGKAAVVEVTPNEFKLFNKAKPGHRLCIVTNALLGNHSKLRTFRFADKWISDNGEKLMIEELVAARISVSP